MISGLSNEVQAKLYKIKPATVGHATRIQGVTPAAISLILVFLKKQQRSGGKNTTKNIKEA